MTGEPKVCSTCKQPKSLDFFYKRSDGNYLSQCKTCSTKKLSADASTGSTYDSTPIPQRDYGARQLLREAILEVMTEEDLLSWLLQHSGQVHLGVSQGGQTGRGKTSKLSFDEISFIRTSGLSEAELAEKFGISRSYVRNLRLGRGGKKTR